MQPGYGFWPGRRDYDKLTQGSPEELLKFEDERREKIARKVKAWLDHVHLMVLREVFWAHQGATEINVYYHPPGLDASMSADLIKYLVDNGGWKAISKGDGLIVGHCPDTVHASHLVCKTYQRFTQENDRVTRIDFPVLNLEKANMADMLALIGDYIEVRLRHLFIDPEQIGRWVPPEPKLPPIRSL